MTQEEMRKACRVPGRKFKSLTEFQAWMACRETLNPGEPFAALRAWLGTAPPSPHDTEIRKLVRAAMGHVEELVTRSLAALHAEVSRANDLAAQVDAAAWSKAAPSGDPAAQLAWALSMTKGWHDEAKGLDAKLEAEKRESAGMRGTLERIEAALAKSHKRGTCDQCGEVWECGACGNPTCNAGHGVGPDGLDCKHCPSAYALTAAYDRLRATDAGKDFVPRERLNEVARNAAHATRVACVDALPDLRLDGAEACVRAVDVEAIATEAAGAPSVLADVLRERAATHEAVLAHVHQQHAEEVKALTKERDALLAAYPEYADPGAKLALREAERQTELVLVDNAKVRVALHRLTGLFKSLVENHEKWGDYQVAVKALAAVPEDYQSALVRFEDANSSLATALKDLAASRANEARLREKMNEAQLLLTHDDEARGVLREALGVTDPGKGFRSPEQVRDVAIRVARNFAAIDQQGLEEIDAILAEVKL